MRCSVVLCTYNGDRFLPDQLGSLLAQTRLPDEIIACDDASSDNSLMQLDAFARHMGERGVSVHVHRRDDNLGYVRNFSDALTRANGDVVFLCDQDDVWQADKLERMTAEFARRPALQLLHTDADLIDAEGCPLGHTLFDALEFSASERQAERNGRAFEVLLGRNTVTGATTAFRRALIERALPVPDSWIHDEWLAICAALYGEVDYLEWPSIGYRQHADNQIGIRKYSHWQRLTQRKRDKRAYMQRVADKLHALLKQHRSRMLALDTRQLEVIRERAAHAYVRGHLPASIWHRGRQVVAEALTGRYWQYSNGLRSIAGDVLDRG